MGPKKKGGKGKKGAEGDEEAAQKDKLLEVDKEWYQIQIKSLEEKLDRRNDRAQALAVSNKEYQERYIFIFYYVFSPLKVEFLLEIFWR